KIHKHLYIHIQNSWVHINSLAKKRRVSWVPLFTKSRLHNDLYELKVYISPESNLYNAILENYEHKGEQLKILDFFKRIAICESITQMLITSHKYHPDDARQVTDLLVYPFVMKMKLD
ncbi:MAG: hypothetical protein ABI581_13340, partial [Sediminibacterium sp.]